MTMFCGYHVEVFETWPQYSQDRRQTLKLSWNIISYLRKQLSVRCVYDV